MTMNGDDDEDEMSHVNKIKKNFPWWMAMCFCTYDNNADVMNNNGNDYTYISQTLIYTYLLIFLL